MFSHDTNLSILFIPFDAAIQHYKRNAQNGVNNYWKSDSNNDVSYFDNYFTHNNMFGDRFKEAAGVAMTTSEISVSLTSIIENICFNMQGSMRYTINPEQINFLNEKKAAGYDVTNLTRRILYPISQFPECIFLSEQPSHVDFPPIITLPTSGISYHQLTISAGSRRVQRIFCYIREDMTTESHSWHAKAMTKYSEQGKVEHILLIEYKNNWASCRFIGVHLSAQNTGLNYGAQKFEASNLLRFCKKYDIDFAIGDFNMNMQLFGGHTGIRAGSTVYLAPNYIGAHEMLFQEHYTNSTNNSHYMGYIIVNQSKIKLTGMDAEGMYGASGLRSISGRYYSDHAPIGVKLAIS